MGSPLRPYEVAELRLSPAIARARSARRWRLGLTLTAGLALLWIIGWWHGGR